MNICIGWSPLSGLHADLSGWRLFAALRGSFALSDTIVYIYEDIVFDILELEIA